MSEPIRNIQTVLFDMDGTLWDTERVSEQAIAELMQEWNLNVDDVDLVEFHGIKWSSIGDRLKARFPALGVSDPAATIAERFAQIQQRTPAPLIAGAAAAFRAAAAQCPKGTAIVTGSDSHDVEAFLDLSDLRDCCATFTSADMYEHSKPHPQCYLMTATRLGVEPSHCLVFEDSEAGMMAAAAAGMSCVAISGGHSRRTEQGHRLAARVIDDFTQLPADFFITVTT